MTKDNLGRMRASSGCAWPSGPRLACAEQVLSFTFKMGAQQVTARLSSSSFSELSPRWAALRKSAFIIIMVPVDLARANRHAGAVAQVSPRPTSSELSWLAGPQQCGARPPAGQPWPGNSTPGNSFGAECDEHVTPPTGVHKGVHVGQVSRQGGEPARRQRAPLSGVRMISREARAAPCEFLVCFAGLFGCKCALLASGPASRAPESEIEPAGLNLELREEKRAHVTNWPLGRRRRRRRRSARAAKQSTGSQAGRRQTGAREPRRNGRKPTPART